MTSTIFVGIGQCGSQVLDSFINQELSLNRTFYPYLLSKNKLSCIFVDTEPKVINKIKTRSKYREILRTENLISGLNGRGSNWCFGYNGCKSAPDISNTVLNILRKEIERCDSFLGLVLCHSIGGGTGSGFGCRLTELIRDEFQMHQIVNCVIAPSDVGGDSPLQYYNCVLSLASLNKSSDGLILFHNDSLLSQLGVSLSSPIKTASSDYKSSPSGHSSLSGGTSGDNIVSMATMNGLLSQQLAALFTSCSSLYPWQVVNSNVSIEINELLRSLCAIHTSKIVRCVSSKSSPHSSDWTVAVKSSLRQLKLGFGNIYDTISSVCSFRGDLKGNCHVPSISMLERGLRSQLHFVDWNKSDCIDVWIGHQPDQNNMVSVAFNSGCVTNYLSYIKSQSALKFHSSAYLHWYYRHGGSPQLFTDSFDELDTIIDDYHQITS